MTMPTTKVTCAALGLALLAGTAGGAFACEYHGSAASEIATRLAQATPAGDQARPARGPQEQSSVASPAPPATRTQTTGATDQHPVVKEMNEQERKKDEKEGK
jgi:hypothetical protein